MVLGEFVLVTSVFLQFWLQSVLHVRKTIFNYLSQNETLWVFVVYRYMCETAIRKVQRAGRKSDSNKVSTEEKESASWAEKETEREKVSMSETESQ